MSTCRPVRLVFRAHLAPSANGEPRAPKAKHRESEFVMPTGVYQRLSPEIRFWPKVVEQADGCWLWAASKNLDGYGRFLLNGKIVLAHRYAYELLVGPIPDGLQLDHLCRVRHCVYPPHLEPVTSRENILRGEGITAKESRKTHCAHGHAFDEANTYHRPSRPQGRYCRTCNRDRPSANLASPRKSPAAKRSRKAPTGPR